MKIACKCTNRSQIAKCEAQVLCFADTDDQPGVPAANSPAHHGAGGRPAQAQSRSHLSDVQVPKGDRFPHAGRHTDPSDCSSLTKEENRCYRVSSRLMESIYFCDGFGSLNHHYDCLTRLCSLFLNFIARTPSLLKLSASLACSAVINIYRVPPLCIRNSTSIIKVSVDSALRK